MPKNKIFFSGVKIGRLIGVIGISVLFLSLLIETVTTNATASSFYALPEQKKGFTPALQVTSTATVQIEPTASYSFSLASLGYEETTLSSPYGTVRYSFRLPENWTVQADSLFTLEFSYVYNQVNETENLVPFGDLTIEFDNQTLQIFPIRQAELDHQQLSIPLPSSLLDTSDRTQHTIRLIFDAPSICGVPQQARLIIHPTSSFNLNYDERPLLIDLADYPRPFYQQAFEQDKVRFVLPSQLTAEHLTNALDVAAKLGDLTNNRLVISSTTDLDLTQLLSPATTTTRFDEHLIVIGRPEDNQLLSFLNEAMELPVSLHQRQVELATQGPTVITPGSTFTYTFTITNTLDQEAEFSLVNPLPAYTEFVSCGPNCTQNREENSILWRSDTLTPNEMSSVSLTLRAAETLTGTMVENTATLIETDLGPVNAETVVSMIVADSTNNESQHSLAEKEGYFFVYNNRALAKEDGVIQEILSPWNKNRAILIITGLSDQAVRKAGQAMSSEVNFPGMNGTVALIKDVTSPSRVDDQTTEVSVERTFADLGYSDEVVQGGPDLKQVDYFFDVPYGWQLTDEAFIELYFNHSQLIDYKDAGLTVYLNRQPLVSTAFSQETAEAGFMQINLKDANIRTGQSNRLTLEVNASPPDPCASSDQAWTLIKNSSKISLAHRETNTLGFDLDFYPYPFHLSSTLTNTLFVLPGTPTTAELEDALRLAAALGDSASGKTVLPAAMLSSDPFPKNPENYHIIAIGRPSQNTLIQQVNNSLPQPFLPDSDQIEQRLNDVQFRLPPDLNLGYLQLIPSPWNEQRAFLVATGTTDQSVNWSINILLNRPQVLKGDLALIREDNEVSTIDTRPLTSRGVAAAIATALPEATPVVETGTELLTGTETLSISPTLSSNPTSTPLVSEPGTNRPTWLIPLVAATSLLVIAIFAFVFWQSWRRT